MDQEIECRGQQEIKHLRLLKRLGNPISKCPSDLLPNEMARLVVGILSQARRQLYRFMSKPSMLPLQTGSTKRPPPGECIDVVAETLVVLEHLPILSRSLVGKLVESLSKLAGLPDRVHVWTERAVEWTGSYTP